MELLVANSSDITDAPPSKIPKQAEAPSPTAPKPTKQSSRSRSARRVTDSAMNEGAPTLARTPRAAEALAMLTRKSEAASPANLPMSFSIDAVTSTLFR